MTEKKRFKIVNLRDDNVCDIQDTSQEILTFYNDLTYNFGSAKAICDLLNDFDEYNKELKQEVELLTEGLKAYDENLPLYLNCGEIREFNSDLFEFKIKRQKFYKEHPRLCKVIIEGKELR